MKLDIAGLFKKENLWVVIIIGVLLLLIAIPNNRKSGDGFLSLPGNKEKDNKETESTEETYLREQRMEEQLEQTLMEIEGVGRTKVFITYKAKKDKNSVPSGLFGTSVSENENTDEGEVEGVLVLCEKGNNVDTVLMISEIIQALFPVDAHKIKVVKMK